MSRPEAVSVEIVVNGAPQTVAPGTTVVGLLASMARPPAAVAVERNGAILPRTQFASTELQAGDRLEIVQFVQGGSEVPRGRRLRP